MTPGELLCLVLGVACLWLGLTGLALGTFGSAASAYPPAWGSNAGGSQLVARGAFRLRNAAKYSRALSDDEIDDLHTGWTPP